MRPITAPRGGAGDRDGRFRRKVIGIYALLILANLAVWAWALFVFRAQTLLLGTALLAYGFGLRHAVDADHIAAIDNVTRKLVARGRRPVTVGLFFALGHSLVVILASSAIALSTTAIAGRFAAYRDIGGLVGTCISALFLFAIAAINMVVLRSVWLTFRRFKQGGRYSEADLDQLLNGSGFASRIFRPLFRLITEAWHMLPLGFLFGLGFDTATEVALLGTSSTQAGHGMPIWSIMVFPALFAAGMSLIDTTDGILMLGAYDWAFVKPIRKLYYNMTITAVSVLVAVTIGGIEALGLVGERLGLSGGGGFWGAVGSLGGHSGAFGFVIITIFMAVWIASVVIYRYKGYDRLDIDQGPGTEISIRGQGAA